MNNILCRSLFCLVALALLSACAGSEEASNSDIEAAETAQLCEGAVVVCESNSVGSFELIADGTAASVRVDEGTEAAILQATKSFRADMSAVSGMTETDSQRVVIVGNIQTSKTLQTMIAEDKLDVSSIDGVWEGFVQAIVDEPVEGVSQALVIAGSDTRGTIYGIYDLSERIGVSPWHWWADVPINQKDTLYLTAGHRSDKPDVKYRGIFLNDENPALLGWVTENYGGFGDEFYAEVFELILRQKGNYIWPAMWGKAYYDDDPDNVALANSYGMVVGTSHHEPLGRAHVEWDRYGDGAWDYNSNEDVLKDFWRGGMERMKDNEVLVTIGMRGDGDEAMTEGTAISLLENIVQDQRAIIADVTGKPASETPQVWALYKEVQDYYDQGMRVPDDVILLFADDNWGNIRRLPELGAKRDGGYGIYYHFDYVGGPRNYKWLNTTQIERVWEQMHLASEYGADELWIVNVGDLKPMEFPISFFLDMGWDTDFISLENLPDYYEDWSRIKFGPAYATEIGALIKGYTKLNARRKPELISPETFSLINFNEAERVSSEWMELEQLADRVRADLDERYHDAYDQLVWWPIKASSNLNHLYIAAAKNKLYAEQGRASANDWADKVEELFARDAELTDYYHTEIADGKWNHFASQTHIGYTYWQQPEQNNMPDITRIDVPENGILSVSVASDMKVYSGGEAIARTPAVDSLHNQQASFTIFNTGKKPLSWQANSLTKGAMLSKTKGNLEQEERINITINWNIIPMGTSVATLEVISSVGKAQRVEIPLSRLDFSDEMSGYVSNKGVIAIDAQDYSEAHDGAVTWKTIANLSRTGSAVAAYPVTAGPTTLGEDSPHLIYDVILPKAGDHTLTVSVAPSLDYWGQGGLKFATSIDNQDPIIQTLKAVPSDSDPIWNEAVANNTIKLTHDFSVERPGQHSVKIWRIDPGVVFQRVEVSQGDVPESYLGPLASQKLD